MDSPPLFINSFIHSGYFYNVSSGPLLLRGAPDYIIDTVSKLTRKAPNLPLSHHVPQCSKPKISRCLL